VEDLQRAASAAANTLDNTYADLVALLRRMDSDLETAMYAMPADEVRPFVLARCDEMADAIGRA
jgi:hypothetical protein